MALRTIAPELGPQKHQKTSQHGGQDGCGEDHEQEEMAEGHGDGATGSNANASARGTTSISSNRAASNWLNPP